VSVTEGLTSFESELHTRGLLAIVRQICKPYALRPDDLKQQRPRQRAPAVIINARAKLAKHLVKKGWSYPMIARLIGYPEHTAVMHLVNRPVAK